MNDKLKQYRDEAMRVDLAPSSVVIELLDEVETLKQRLAECEKVLRFYADDKNWAGYHHDCTSIMGDDVPDVASDGFKVFYGGRRAREYFKRKEGGGV